MNILITGVGAASGIGAIMALRKEFKKQYQLIGVDSSKYAASFFKKDFLDNYYCIPTANDKNYINSLLKICQDQKINIILPCTDFEMIPLSNNQHLFTKINVKIIVSTLDTIKITRDKWLTFEKLKDSIDVAHSYLPKHLINNRFRDLDFPLIVKPRIGGGDKDVYLAYDIDELQVFIKRVENPIIQEYLSKEEYSIDTLTDENSCFISAVPRLRQKTMGGAAVVSKIIYDQELIEFAKKTVDTLKFKGPINIQVRKNNQNQIKLFEINSRFPGTGILTVEAGCNIAAMSIKSFSGEAISFDKTLLDTNLMITRYIDNVFMKIQDVKNEC